MPSAAYTKWKDPERYHRLRCDMTKYYHVRVDLAAPKSDSQTVFYPYDHRRSKIAITPVQKGDQNHE